MRSPGPAWTRLEATKPENPTNAIIPAIFGMDMKPSILRLLFDEQNNDDALS